MDPSVFSHHKITPWFQLFQGYLFHYWDWSSPWWKSLTRTNSRPSLNWITTRLTTVTSSSRRVTTPRLEKGDPDSKSPSLISDQGSSVASPNVRMAQWVAIITTWNSAWIIHPWNSTHPNHHGDIRIGLSALDRRGRRHGQSLVNQLNRLDSVTSMSTETHYIHPALPWVRL